MAATSPSTPSKPTAAALAAWRRAQAVCFDVDSTVSPDEGIDVLAAFAKVGDRVAELTRSAMGGGMNFQDALRARLELIRPTRAMIEACLLAHPPRLNPGIAQLVEALERRGTAVYLVSGGFEPFVLPLAEMLRLPPDRVIANRFVPVNRAEGAQGAQGAQGVGGVMTFDPACPTARSGGKGVALAGLKRAHGYEPLVMIGDGVTDMEARPPADLFIGYGGIAARAPVQAGADWYVTEFQPLRLALTDPGS